MKPLEYADVRELDAMGDFLVKVKAARREHPEDAALRSLETSPSGFYVDVLAMVRRDR